jgi:hypothetical protein
MEPLKWKTRIAVLWMIQAVAFAATIFLALFGSETIKQISETQVGEGTKVLLSVFFLIPCIMAWISLTLKGSANRWASFILGILYAVIKLIVLIEGFAEGGPSGCVGRNLWPDFCRSAGGYP